MNILWVVLDALRYNHLGIYGYQRETSPNIDRLAREGVVYEKAYSTAGWSLPSHASMFTGLYPTKHGAHDEQHYLSDRYVTLPALLASSGYQTALFNGNAWLVPEFGMTQGFDFIDDSIIRGKRLSRLSKQAVRKLWKLATNTDGAGAPYFTSRALAWLKHQIKDDKPFFAFIHYGEPHRPYKMQRILQMQFAGETSIGKALRVNQDHDAYIAGAVEMVESDFSVLRTIYDSMIYYADQYVGKLIKYLRDQDKLDDTMVIVTADHGENFGEHSLLDHKLCLYETLIHVPLIIRCPRYFKPGTRERGLVQHVDIFPTLMDILHIDAPEIRDELQGVSLVHHPEGPRRLYAIAEQAYPNLKSFNKYPFFDSTPYNRRLKAVVHDQLKYIWASDGQHELYDLENDPGEEVNLIFSNLEKVAELHNILDSWMGSFEPNVPEQNLSTVDPAVIDRLAGLGYIE